MEKVKGQDKLEQILVAAQKRFHHYGLSKTTMNEIADDIGMSKAALYYYFKDKESIFSAVVQREQEHFMQEMRKLLDRKGKAETMLAKYVSLRIDLLKKMLFLGKFSHDSLMEVKPLFGRLFSSFRKKELALIVEVLQSGIDNGEFTVDQVKKQSEFFLDTLRWIRQGIIYGPGTDTLPEIPPAKLNQLKNHSRQFTQLFIRGLKP